MVVTRLWCWCRLLIDELQAACLEGGRKIEPLRCQGRQQILRSGRLHRGTEDLGNLDEEHEHSIGHRGGGIGELFRRFAF